MTKKTAFLIFAFLAITLLALFVRTWRLDLRPMHHDEANQAVRTGILLETGVYEYDPDDHHGPGLYYLAASFIRLYSGKDFASSDEVGFRLIPALFGVALIPMLLLFRRSLSAATLLAAALLTAISPAMVFYSRYFIQEMILVFFSFAAVAAGWRYFLKPSFGWALAFGLSAGLMFATKETSALAFAAMAIALGVVALGERKNSGAEALRPAGFRLTHVALSLGAGAGIAAVLFSSFGRRPQGMLDSLSAFWVYFERGFSQSLHVHPWWFYFETLGYTRSSRGPVWTEGLILALALGGIAFAWRRSCPAGDRRLTRFLAAYGLALALLYSAVPYKTPWCALSFLHPLILLAGVAVGGILGSARAMWAKIVFAFLLIAGLVHLGWLCEQANFRYYADPGNPYVYSQTSRDFLKLVSRVDEIAAVSPEGRRMFIQVVTDPYSAWPLPWYLRSYSRVGYWESPKEAPSGVEPSMIITTPELQSALEPRLTGRYQTEFFGLRPGAFLLLSTREDLWDKFLASRRR